MKTEDRLAQIVTALEQVGLDVLIMDGHAVRYYGVGRNTVDFDFYVSAASMNDVRDRIAGATGLQARREGPSWRPDDFARFEIGRLPDGREEWLEFWLHNHLLPHYPISASRRELGQYGGRFVSFISLSDLLRSKETEREGDWQDISLLEEVRDARNLAHATPQIALSQMRSRKGFRSALEDGLYSDHPILRAALELTEHPVSAAFLLPAIDPSHPVTAAQNTLDRIYLQALQHVQLGDQKHLALVEVVRRAYKRSAMEIDRLDKQTRLGR